MVLIVVDTQNIIVNSELFNFSEVVSNIKILLNEARKNNIEDIYVQHNDGNESQLTEGKYEFEIYKEFEPKEKEERFIKKVNSPFKESGLLQYLKQKKEQDLIIVGLQTEYCIDATIKCGCGHMNKLFFDKNKFLMKMIDEFLRL